MSAIILPHKVWQFFGWFVLIYGLLILPLTPVVSSYGAFFRFVAHKLYASEEGQRELTFLTLPEEHGKWLNRIEIVNLKLMSFDGSGPMRNLDIDVGGFWRITAFNLALCLATPIALFRRIGALVGGFLLTQCFVFLTVGFSIANESHYLDLGIFNHLSPFLQNLTNGLQNLLVSQLSIAVPVLVWVIIVFRKTDILKQLGIFKISNN